MTVFISEVAQPIDVGHYKKIIKDDIKTDKAMVTYLKKNLKKPFVALFGSGKVYNVFLNKNPLLCWQHLRDWRGRLTDNALKENMEMYRRKFNLLLNISIVENLEI